MAQQLNQESRDSTQEDPAHKARDLPAATERTLIGLITDVQNGLAKIFRDRTRHLGISRSQWRVLAALSGRPGATQTELADLVGIGRAPLGKIIDRLEGQGWVERHADPNDRRVNLLYLTRDIRPITEPTREISKQIIGELMEDFPEEDRLAFERGVQHLHSKLHFASMPHYIDSTGDG